MHQARAPTIEDEDDEVEVVPTLALTMLVAIPKKPSTSVRAEAERKGKALMTSTEPETPQEHLQISARVLKYVSAIKSKSLAEKMLKMILLSQDWQDRKNHWRKTSGLSTQA